MFVRIKTDLCKFSVSFGTIRVADSHNLQIYTESYGLDLGMKLFKVRKEVSDYLTSRVSFEIVLISTKLVTQACVKNKIFMQTFDKNSTVLLEQLNQHLAILVNQVKDIGDMLPKLVLMMDEMMLRSESGMWYAKSMYLVEIKEHT